MENRNRTSVYIPKSLYDYLGNLGNDHYKFNRIGTIYEAYEYGTNLSEEQLTLKVKEKIAQYHELFIKSCEKVSVQLIIPKTRPDYNQSQLVTLYILIFLDVLMPMLHIEKEKEYSV